MVVTASKRWSLSLAMVMFAASLVLVSQGQARADVRACDGQWADSATCSEAGADDVCGLKSSPKKIWLTSSNVELRYSGECRTVWTRWKSTGLADFVKVERNDDGAWQKTTVTSGGGDYIWTKMLNDANTTSFGCATDQNGGWMGWSALTKCTASY